MKKKVIFSIIAFSLSLASVNANATTSIFKTLNSEMTSAVNPFCMAIVQGDFETVKKLIDLGEDVNQKSSGLSPAMYAAKFNKVDILKLLINKGANLKARCSKGHTALKYAKLSNAKDAKAIIVDALAKRKGRKV
jgi:ankyrin repeat protein